MAAEHARQIGLLNRVVPAAELRDIAFRLARELAAKPPHAMRIGRGAFMRVNDLGYRRSIEGVVDTLCSLITSPETQEGLAAFVEKRPPRW